MWAYVNKVVSVWFRQCFYTVVSAAKKHTPWKNTRVNCPQRFCSVKGAGKQVTKATSQPGHLEQRPVKHGWSWCWWSADWLTCCDLQPNHSSTHTVARGRQAPAASAWHSRSPWQAWTPAAFVSLYNTFHHTLGHHQRSHTACHQCSDTAGWQRKWHSTTATVSRLSCDDYRKQSS